jgi:glycosyltransferase involved in cell wall biosynthesis
MNSESGLKLLFFGRLSHYKGVELLPSILSEFISNLSKHNKRSRVVLFLVSPHASAISQLLCESIAEQFMTCLEIRAYENIKTSDLHHIVSQCMCLLFPSTTSCEAFGLVLLEAMSAGVPAVSFDIPKSGVSYVNSHLKVGYVAQYLSITDFVNGIHYCISNRDILISNMPFHLEKFTLNYFLQNILHCLND